MRLLQNIAIAGLLFLLPPQLSAQRNIEPEVFTLTFTEEQTAFTGEEHSAPRPEDWPDWITGSNPRNGAITADGTWQGKVNDDGAETGINLLIDNPSLKSDLALTLSFSTETVSDFAIQIYDSKNKVVAVDLFGNVTENSELTGTDTYIIPLSRYPSASRIAIRQVSGQLTLFGLIAFPVLAELPADTGAEMTMLNLLGGELSEESRLYRALNQLIPETERSGLKGPNGEPLSREEIIKSLKTEIVQELSQNKAEFEKRLVGTEWYLQDFYKRRLARFLPEGRMLQQHSEEKERLRWNEKDEVLVRSYRVLDHQTVLFGIGGFVATFNDNFTEMTYETASGRKGKARLVGRFDVKK